MLSRNMSANKATREFDACARACFGERGFARCIFPRSRAVLLRDEAVTAAAVVVVVSTRDRGKVALFRLLLGAPGPPLLLLLLLPPAGVEERCSRPVPRDPPGPLTDLQVLPQRLEPSREAQLEARAALLQAQDMRRHGKREKAHKLLVHALNVNPALVEALTELGTILEEEKDVVQADHLYSRALAISPCNQRALASRVRTLPLVEEIDQRRFDVIDGKVRRLMSIPKGNSALRRVVQETYYHHIYHTVAIEGNTLTLSEIRHIIETRYAVAGKSLREQNEAIGVDAAMKYINTTLLSRAGAVAVDDLLEIHRRVLGYVDPVEAGRFRSTQVFVGHHVPPPPQELRRHVQELVQWLNSEEALHLHPVEFAALAHYKLVHVHPFVDGNGRTSRLLMNLILMQASYPPITIRKEQRAEYYAALDTANEGDVRPFIRFIAQCTELTLDTLLIATAERAVGLPGHCPERTIPAQRPD